MSCQASNSDIQDTKTRDWFVYIIVTDQPSLYTGISTDPSRRFQEHLATAEGNSKARGAKFFRRAKPLKIVYSEKFDNRSQASQREAQIKALSAAQKQKLIKNS